MMYQRGQLQWIESSGGPLILLSSEALAAWWGHNPPRERQERDMLSNEETDYERACAVEDDIGVLTVSDKQAVILGEEPLPTAWRRVSATEGILVRWVYGEDQENVPQYLGQIDEDIWRPSGVSFVIGTEPLYLFDAAWPGIEATEYLVISLHEGYYSIDTGILRPDNRTELIMHRLQRV